MSIIHRDVKFANILLDESFIAKVSDFGASRSLPFDQTHVTTLVQGTLGYLDPEYFRSSRLTEKSDVYSFRVVLAELLARQIPISQTKSEPEVNLTQNFVTLLNDDRLLQVTEPQIVEEAGLVQQFMVTHNAKNCLSLKGEERPSMMEVAMELEGVRRLRNQHLNRQKISDELTIKMSRQFSIENDMVSSTDIAR